MSIISRLPLDIIAFIFLKKLTLKCLFTLKCVDKFFYEFISNPNFIRAHLKILTEDDSLANYRVIVKDAKQFSLQSLLSGESCGDFIDLPNSYCSVVGCINGLICVAKDKFCGFWNPSLGNTHFSLSPLDVNSDGWRDITYGFGYDESTDDYKAVACCTFSKDDVLENYLRYYSVVKVYCLKTNSWKRIADFNGGVLDDHSTKVASGKIHWFTDPWFDHVNSKKDIVSFDIEREVFGLVDQPDYYGDKGGDYSFQTTLSVLQGCICVLFNDQQTHADLWVMKTYGVKSSWTIMVTIPDVLAFGVKPHLGACFMMPNGNILLNTNKCFVLYSPKDASFTFPEMRNLDNYLNLYRDLKPVVYVENVASPWRQRFS